MFTPKKCMHQDSFLAKGQSERKKKMKNCGWIEVFQV